VLVQALVSQTAIERLDIRILIRLARFDQLKRNCKLPL